MKLAEYVSTVPGFPLTIDAVEPKCSLLGVLRELGTGQTRHAGSVFWRNEFLLHALSHP